MVNLHSTRSRRASFVAAAITLGLLFDPLSASFALLVAGGGPSKSDCYMELDVKDICDVSKNKIVKCADGDPCDTDGATNGSCTFEVALCPNQSNVAGCSSTSVTSVTAKVKGGTLNTPTNLSASTCGTSSTITVPLKKNNTNPGKAIVHIN